MDHDPAPLAGVRVLDFSSLLPGPLATSMLADAGADVVKVERPGAGDDVRSYSPHIGGTSAIYALLNRGKRAYAVDLSSEADHRRVMVLAATAHVVVEQFRPGVADRLGIGFEAVRRVNPGVVYCSISGYGQDGPLRQQAGHDLNYLAQSGLLSTVTDVAGNPQLPVATMADIAGGSYPAVVNILMALRRSEITGRGCHIDVSMTHNLQVLAFASIAAERAGAGWPRPSAEMLTGGSPRYRVYATSDGRHVAVAALEQKFWLRLADLIGLPPEFHRELGREPLVVAEVARCFAGQTAEHWRGVLAEHDTCATVVDTFPEAVAAGLVDGDDSPRRVAGDGYDVPALHSPVAPPLRPGPPAVPFPGLESLPEDVGSLWRGDAAAGTAQESGR